MKVDGQEIPTQDFKYQWAAALMRRGVIVKLAMSRWRATTKLTSEDLGLRFVDEDSFRFNQKYIDLGKQKLLPVEMLRELEFIDRRARRCLAQHTFETVWGRFLPATAFSQYDEENKQIKEDYIQCAKRLGYRYDEIIEMVKQEYRNMARDVWARIYPESSGKPSDSFVEDFVIKVVNKIPSREKIVASFKYDITYLTISMPTFLEKQVSDAEAIKRQRETDNLRHVLEKRVRERMAEEYINKRTELVDSFLESTVLTMRNYVSDLCQSVLSCVGRIKRVGIPQMYFNRLHEMIEKVRFLNFYDDDEVSKLIDELETEINKIKGERDKDLIQDKLQEIINTVKEEFAPTNFNPLISYLEV